MPDMITPPVVVAPDREGIACVGQALASAGIEVRGTILKSRSWVKETRDRFAKHAGLLVLIPSPSLGREQLDVVKHVMDLGGVVLAWTAAYREATSKRDDVWLVDRLLEQAGVLTTPRISCLVAAARIAPMLRFPLPASPAVRITGRANSVQARLVSALDRAEVPMGLNDAVLTLQVGEAGEVLLKSGEPVVHFTEGPDAVAEAVALLFSIPAVCDGCINGAWQVDEMAVAEIVQPPKRLLSETTSKKLARIFGLVSPNEHLCRSASEAVRFAKSLGGPAVFKLVKPRLTDKAAKHAVIMNVEGAPSARRTAGELETLGVAMGPPNALGILVAEQVRSTARISLEIHDHPMFGRLVLGSPGDVLRDHPALALLAPATIPQARSALRRAAIGESAVERERLAHGISRFAHMAYELGLQVDRLEVHPLVASGDCDNPLMLDALISIAIVG